MSDRYFVSDQFETRVVMRRTDAGDEAFTQGAWRTTTQIVDFEYGENDFLTEVTREQAIDAAPDAFAPATAAS